MHGSRRTFLTALAAATLAPLRARAEGAVRDTAVTDPRSGRRASAAHPRAEGVKRMRCCLLAWAWQRHHERGRLVRGLGARGLRGGDDGSPITDKPLGYEPREPQRQSQPSTGRRAVCGAGGGYAFRDRRCLDEAGLGIASRIDPERIGVAGHSYGAITVQALAVEAAKAKGAGRVRAVIALSPGVITPANAAAMSAARLPFLCVTGDQDNFVTFTKGGHARRLGRAAREPARCLRRPAARTERAVASGAGRSHDVRGRALLMVVCSAAMCRRPQTTRARGAV